MLIFGKALHKADHQSNSKPRLEAHEGVK